jgi:hypothetical protein
LKLILLLPRFQLNVERQINSIKSREFIAYATRVFPRRIAIYCALNADRLSVRANETATSLILIVSDSIGSNTSAWK